MSQVYSPEEEQLIRELYATHTAKAIAMRLSERFGTCRTQRSVQNWATSHGLRKREAYRSYTEEEQAFIRAHYAKMSGQDLVAALQERFGVVRSVQSLQNWVSENGAHKLPRATESEQELIDRYYGIWSNRKIASEIKRQFGIKRTPQAVRCMAHRMGIHSADNHGLIPISLAAELAGVPLKALQSIIEDGRYPFIEGHPARLLTEETVEIIKRDYAPPPWPAYSTAQTARMLGITRGALLDLRRKHPERFTSHRRGPKNLFIKAEDVFAEMRRRGMRPPLTYAAS